MSSAWIKTRVAKDGKRYLVYYRRGGRYTLQEYGGSFKTTALARERKKLIDGELAAGRDPKLALVALSAPRIEKRTLLDRWNGFITARVDVGTSASALYRNARDRFEPFLGELDPAEITAVQVQAAVLQLLQPDDDDARPLSRGTVGQYLSTLRQVLDHCDIEPNPARSPKVRLPSAARQEIVPPSTVEWKKIKQAATVPALLPLRLIECCGLRVSEAATLTYGDIDFAGRLRISKARTKTRAGRRWIPVPAELLDEIAELCPLEDRHPGRQVFDRDAARLRTDLRLACRDAEVAHYHPHELRHRRVSLWFAHGFDQITISRWAGHANASMSSDTYGHVVVSSDDEWRDFWLAAYDQARRPRALAPSERGAPVGHQEPQE